MLIETSPRRKRKVGADADEQSAPLAVEQIEVVLVGPPPFVFQMPAVVFADGDKDAGRFAGFQDDYDSIRLRATEVRLDELVPTVARRGFDERGAPLRRTSCHPVVVLTRYVAEHGSAHRVQLAIGVEESHDAFGLLEWLNQSIEQDSIEAPVPETNAIVVMLVEGVHGRFQVVRQPGSINPGAPLRASRAKRAL